MKRKVFWLIILSLIALLVLAGSALGSAHGFFENYPIVKLFVDNEEKIPEVPAIILKGRTLVPLRFIGEELGAELHFDPDKYAVYLKLPEPSQPANLKKAAIVDYLQANYGEWEIGGRLINFNPVVDDNYKGSNDLFVSFQVNRNHYLNWHEIKRLYSGEIKNKIENIISYLEKYYPQSGINFFVVLQTYHDSYDQLAKIVDLKEIAVDHTGRFIIEETLATGFCWPGASQPKISIE